MDQAIYEPVTDTIFGVSGQWLYQFNATTGAFIQGTRFTTDAQSPSSIATDGAGKLFCGVAKAAFVDWGSGSAAMLDRDIFLVDAATLAVTRFNFGGKFGGVSDGPSSIALQGWINLIYGASRLFGNRSDFSGAFVTAHVFKVDPLNLPGYSEVGNTASEDMAFDATNSLIWIALGNGDGIGVIDAAFANSASGFGTPDYPPYSSGVCFNSANNKGYCATNSKYLMQASGTAAVAALTAGVGFGGTFTVTVLDTGRATCNARRIKSVNGFRSNPLNGQLLIPSPADDTVLVWNPALDTSGSMVIKTGFTAPFDVVVCPTANFALQSGTTGLKQIT